MMISVMLLRAEEVYLCGLPLGDWERAVMMISVILLCGEEVYLCGLPLGDLGL